MNLKSPLQPWFMPVALGVMGVWWVAALQVHWRTLPEFQHGWLVPFLAAFLAHERWAGRGEPASPRTQRGPLLLALGSAPLVVVAELYRLAVANGPSSSFALSLGCAGFATSLIWSAYGWSRARRFLFPILFLLVAVPIPKSLWNPVVLGLQGMIAALNVEALNLLGVPAARTGNVLQLPTGAVGVDEACSGIRSLQSSIMAALFIADLTFRRAGAKVFFLVAGVALAVIGNFGRSLYLSLTAARRGVEAVAAVHDTAGWSVLLFTAAGVVALAWMVSRAERRLAAAGAISSPGTGTGA